MKTKLIISAACIITVFSFLAFKKSPDAGGSKVILISVMNGRDEAEGFVITYGNGTKETRPFTSKIKVMNPETFVPIQAQAAVILNEFKEKGYHYVGTHTAFSSYMILEKD